MPVEIDLFFPVMDWLCENLLNRRVPIISGFIKLNVSKNDLIKYFSAVFGMTGTTSLAYLFCCLQRTDY